MKTKMLLLSVLFILLGCKEEYNSTKLNQEVLFKIEYVNYAWGYQHSVLMIDSTGKVWSFHLPEKWNFADNNGYISLDNMKDNLNQLEITSIKINKDTLLKYYSKLMRAACGDLTEPKTEMYDAGSTSFSGFIYHPKTKKYKEVLIRQIGDVYIENKSTEAMQIYNWLISLKPQELSFPY